MRKFPALAVDGIVILNGQIVLIERKNPPFRGNFALPGGFIEVGETVEEAVVREVEEETGLKTSIKGLVGIYSDPKRDPRGHTVSIVFELKFESGELKGGDDALSAKLFRLDNLPALAFDHGKIIQDFITLFG